jgi:hypothetical protein
MAQDTVTIILRVADLPAFRAAVIACAGPGDRHRCERLLGQLASLESAASEPTLRFVPARATAPLARRAREHLHAISGPYVRAQAGRDSGGEP